MLENIVMAIGITSAVALVVALLAGNLSPRLRIWPAPPAKSFLSFAVWTLFRALNVAVLIVCLAHLAHNLTTGRVAPLQVLLMAAAAMAFAAYLWTLWVLGRRATYCRASGLTREGAYGWSRNPQYATAIAAYIALGLATASPAAAALAATLAVVYALMAIAEEPWLEAAYGESYRLYRAQVPRFFDVRRLAAELNKLLRPQRPAMRENALASAHRLRRPRT